MKSGILNYQSLSLFLKLENFINKNLNSDGKKPYRRWQTTSNQLFLNPAYS